MLASAHVFAQQATVTTFANTYNRAGAGKASALTTGVPTLGAKFNSPMGIALDSSGTAMFVADYNNNAIRYIYGLGNNSSSVTFTIYNNTRGINHPVGVAVDFSNNVYVLNYGKKGTDGSLMVFNGSSLLNYGYITAITTRATNLVKAAGLTLDYFNNAYITIQGNTVIRVTPSGVTTLVGTIKTAKTALTGITYLANGQLAISDAGNNGIWIMNPANTNLFSNATPLTGFHGAGDFLGDSTSAMFNHPEGIVQAGNGILVVADCNNNQVKLVDTNGNVGRLFGVPSSLWKNAKNLATKGWKDGTSNPQIFLDTVQSDQPFGLAIDAKGNVYDSEEHYDLLREATGTGLLPPPSPFPLAPINVSANAGYGYVNLTWSPVTTATNYNVKRATFSGSEVTIYTTTNTSYADTNVLDGTNYYYEVSAINTAGEGSNSSEVSALPLFSPTPNSLIVTATNFGLVSLAWAPSAGATSYNIKRSTSTSTETTIGSTSSLIYNDTGVSNGVTYYYVVSAVNGGGENPTNSAEVSVTVPTPPPPAPTIGWFDYEGSPVAVTTFHPYSGTPYIAHNGVDINFSFAIEPNLDGVQTKYTIDGSNPSATNGFTANFYQNGQQLGLNGTTPLPISAAPNLVIKAENFNSGGNSPIVTAVYQFVAADPSINGNNAADLSVNDATIGAQLLYTTDGTDPRTNINANVVGPISGTNSIQLPVITFPANTDSILFQIVAFKANYQTSSVVSKTFFASNAVYNTIDFGFAAGPGSCQFVASPGQTFVVPVALNLLADAPPIYGLQFNLTVTNLGAIPVAPGAVDFDSLLGKPDQFNDGYYLVIPPYAFLNVATKPSNDPAAIFVNGSWYQGMQFTNFNNENLLGVGWLEIYGRTNLYNTLSQNLLTFPILRGNEPYPSKSQSVVGGYKFMIPTNASSGDVYQIQIGRPSGITFGQVGYGTPVLINAPADTNLVGPGSLNALKNVTIGYKKYLVGDVYPANWFNAGDFGTMDLVTNGVTDVSRVFDFAVYPVAAPPANSDLFDALDSCGNFGYTNQFGYYTNANTYPQTLILTNAVTNYTSVYVYDTNINAYATNSYLVPSSIDNYTNTIYITTYLVGVPFNITNIYQPLPPNAPFENIVQDSYITNITPAVSALFDGNDTNINQIAFGDGVLDVCDVYVTFRRSLDSSLLWFERFWTNGQRAADTAIRNPAAHVVSKLVSANLVQPRDTNSAPSSVPPLVVFNASTINGTAGQVVQVPITANITGNYNLRLLMLNLSVLPMANAPALNTQVQFTQTATALGSPHLTDSIGNGNYAAVWLNSPSEGATGVGLTGTVTLGYLSVTIPAGAASGSSYTVNFDHASASPNGLASFPVRTVSGSITVK